ncbi:MAG: PD40 domain-containing protein [Armatimonadetes bacterium]|nr:PD40 domain-containing protein [Armatimonadota bacterium]
MLLSALLLISQPAFVLPQPTSECFAHSVLASLGEPVTGPKPGNPDADKGKYGAPKLSPEERHFKNLKQLTFGGQNAEAYWNVAGDSITFQAHYPGYPDEQIFTMKADGSNKRLISTGEGRCTCSYFTPDGKAIYFSSTFEKNKGPQTPVDMSKGYVWKVNPQFALYKRTLATGKITKILDNDHYVAETTISPNGKYMTFTSTVDGDLEIYRSDLNGKNIIRLTNNPGYDGGPFVSWDGSKIAFRRDLIESDTELSDYQSLLKSDMVRPSKLEIWIMDADGSNMKQVTKLGAASFAPFITPDGKSIIFTSNYGDPKGREFDLFMVNIDGTNVRRLTHTPEFDGFPMFTKDGTKLVWASNRNGLVRGETNIFVADWLR